MSFYILCFTQVANISFNIGVRELNLIAYSMQWVRMKDRMSDLSS